MLVEDTQDYSELKAPIRYYGGKGKMLKRLLPWIPLGGRPYCEPFLGAGSTFFARPPAPVEVLNDLDNVLVNLFRVLQEPALFERLHHKLLYTLYSRAEFIRALEILEDPSQADAVDLAWAKFVIHNQGFGGKPSYVPGDWGRTFISHGNVAETNNRWLMRLAMLTDWHRRLLMAQIDNRDGIEVIRYWDNSDAVFYVDPPYHPDAIADKRPGYRHNLSQEQHQKLIETLLGCQGAVTLSGYPNADYETLTKAGWKVVQFKTACHAAGKGRGSPIRGSGAALSHVPRTECVWLNQKAQALLEKQAAPIFSLVGCSRP